MKQHQTLARQARLAASATELALAAPVVVAHRLARLAAADLTNLSSRDRREFHAMGAEKLAAFGASYQAMVLQSLRSGQQVAWSMTHTWWRSALGALPAAAAGAWLGPLAAAPAQAALQQLQAAQLAVLSKGLAPVRRRAVANARRLSRARAR